jgi:hypothetical protein
MKAKCVARLAGNAWTGKVVAFSSIGAQTEAFRQDYAETTW